MAGGNRGNLNSTLSGVYLRMVGFYERADRGRTNQNTNTNYFLHGAGFFCSSHGVDCRQMAKKTGPRKVAIAGGLVLGLGYMLAGFSGTHNNPSFWGILLGIGLLGGTGIGLGYVCPIVALVKWFPDKKE